MPVNVIAPVGDDLITDGFHAAAKTIQTFGGLSTVRKLVVIEGIFLADLVGRKIGHDDIGSGEDAHFPAVWMDRAQGGGGRKENLGADETNDAEQVAGQFHSTSRMGAQRCVGVRYKRTDAAHLRLKCFYEFQIFG